MPVVSADHLGTPSALAPLTAYRWFMHYGASYGTAWQNQVTIAVRDASQPFEPLFCAARLRVPSLFVVAFDDEMPGARSEVARHACRLAPGPADLLEVGGGHFGLLYHPSELFDQVSRVESDFLLRHLAGAPSSRPTSDAAPLQYPDGPDRVGST